MIAFLRVLFNRYKLALTNKLNHNLEVQNCPEANEHADKHKSGRMTLSVLSQFSGSNIMHVQIRANHYFFSIICKIYAHDFQYGCPNKANNTLKVEKLALVLILYDSPKNKGQKIKLTGSI